MANCLNVEAIRMEYFRREHPNSRVFHGFIVSDDYESYEVMEFSSKEEVPDTLEKVLRHCMGEEHGMAFDLFAQHATAGKGVNLDGKFIDAEKLQRILDILAKEDEME